MRLSRLDLLRFGHFTDRPIGFPAGERDLHVVFGANEAGKTTTLTAIEDLLFGIDDRSPYNFLHAYEDMRLGAELDDGENRLEFLRRKGRARTVLDADGNPLPGGDDMLAPFIGRADRDFFRTMFNLSHDRLAEGGRAILDAEGDVGQMLFSAGTGLTDLRARLTDLESEADSYWGPRKAAHRLYAGARDRFDDAKRRQREYAVTLRAWRAARKAVEEAETSLAGIRERREESQRELAKLQRIRRVHKSIRRKSELEEALAAMGDIVALPEDAAQRLTDAERTAGEIGARLELLQTQREENSERIATIVFDMALVERAGDVESLGSERSVVLDRWADLPKRRAELETLMNGIGRLAQELGREGEGPDELIAAIPDRGRIARVRNLIVRHGELRAELRTATSEYGKARETLAERQRRLKALPAPVDTARLAATCETVRGKSDAGARIDAARQAIEELRESVARDIALLRPALPDGTDIEILAVPSRATLETHRENMGRLEEQCRDLLRGLREARDEFETARVEHDRRIGNGELVTAEALAGLRASRNSLWNQIRIAHIEHGEIDVADQDSVKGLESLPEEFENAMGAADAGADRRFETAEEAGALAELSRGIARHELRVRQLETAREEQAREKEALDAAWTATWREVPIEPASPAEMLDWLERHAAIVTARTRLGETERELARLESEETDARETLFAELEALEIETTAKNTDALDLLLEHAGAILQDQKALDGRRTDLEEEVRAAESEREQRERAEATATASLAGWREEWVAAVTAAGLNEDIEVEAAAPLIEIIERMRESAGEALELRDRRIATIERDIVGFEERVAGLLGEIAPDLADRPADEAVLEIVRRRDEALELQRRHAELSERLATLTGEIDAIGRERAEAWAAIEPLKDQAGTADLNSLRAAIARSDEARASRDQLDSVLAQLTSDGDGLPIERLEEECLDQEIDQVQARIQALEDERPSLDAEFERAAEIRNESRRAFDAIGGGNAAAHAAADRQEALAMMREAAAGYVRTKTAARLLRWAIDRYRSEKQGPLLTKAGRLFHVLTLGSFERLDVRFDNRDELRLVGLRSSGESVEVGGLSTGSEDQLFLALRLAALEDYLEHAPALPFVADDLFINFDDARSAAGFEVLGELSRRTQVLFFTHHAHLVDLARRTLGDEVHVVELA